MKIINAKVFIDGKFHEGLEVRYDKDRILEIGENLKDEEVIDAKGNYLFAGIVDCHVHGGFQRSVTEITNEDKYGPFEEQVRYLCDKLAETGVTTFYPTVNPDTAPYAECGEITRRIRAIRDTIRGAYPLKFHYETAFVTMDRYVEISKDWMQNPTKEISDIMVDHDYSDVAIISVAPEMEGAIDYIDYIVSKGVMPEIGYDKATAEQTIEAADHGLCQATHLYNGYLPMHHRASTSSAAVLYDDRIKTQITMDGVHVHPIWVKITLKTKGIENCYGITDLCSYAGMPDGWYTMSNGNKFQIRDGFCYHEHGHLVAGANKMDDMMRRAHNIVGLSREEVGLLYCENPAKCLNLNDRGKIEVGRISDFVIMDEDYHVLRTIIKGETYYENRER